MREETNAKLKLIEQRRQVTEHITEKVQYIMSLSPDDGVRWGGSKADLLELLHEVYIHGRLLMPDGRMMMMHHLVRTCFTNLGLTVMKNIHSHVQRAEARKGIRSGNIIERIRYMMFDAYHGSQHLQDFWDSMIIG